MKVIKPSQKKIWTLQVECTGTDQSGCGAILEVDEDDLYCTDGHPDHNITFTCCECAEETDIPVSTIPYKSQPKLWKQAWLELKDLEAEAL